MKRNLQALYAGKVQTYVKLNQTKQCILSQITGFYIHMQTQLFLSILHERKTEFISGQQIIES